MTRNIDFQGFHDTFQWEDSWVPFVPTKNDDILARTFNGSKGHSSEVVDTLVAVVMANVQTSLAQVQRPPWLLDSGPPMRKSYSW